MVKHRAARPWWALLHWTCCALWLLAQWLIVVGIARQGQRPVDFLAYERAATAVARGTSPYGTPELAQAVWRRFHAQDAAIRGAATLAEGRALARAQLAAGQEPGPYLYPPTLALLLGQLRIGPVAFGALVALAIAAFAALWLRATGHSAAWLWLVIASWDVLASSLGGNVELILLGATLSAAWLLWPPYAAPLIALVALIKPFYALFFVAFGALLFTAHPAPRRAARSLAAAAALALALAALEVARWGGPLRAATVDYLRHALGYQWFALPVAEQTPMSAWNRTPMQGLVNLGVPADVAQWAALTLWPLPLGVTLWWARGRPLGFPLAFALAFVLLYWGRPVGWGLPFLDVVVLAAAWPALARRGRALLLAAAVALAASHWGALALSVAGRGLVLFTPQRPEFPWETWLVLPACWLLLLRVPPAPRAQAQSVRNVHAQ
jgi:hypothetical protein